MAGLLDLIRQERTRRLTERAQVAADAQVSVQQRLADAEQQRAQAEAARMAPGLAAALGRLSPQGANPNVGAGMNPADPGAQAVGLMMDPRTRQLGAAQAGALLDPLGRQQLANAQAQGLGYQLDAQKTALEIDQARRLGPANLLAAQALTQQRLAAARASEAAAAAAAAGRIEPIEARVNQRWLANMGEPVAVQDSLQQIDAALRQGDSLGSLAATIKLAKILDPTSVVREGEVTTVEGGTGTAQQLVSAYNRLRGEGMSPQASAALLRTAKSVALPILSRGQRLTAETRRLAEDYGIVPDRVTTGLGWSSDYVAALQAELGGAP